jgi:ABC-type tungstate transport system substrate-binding protein
MALYVLLYFAALIATPFGVPLLLVGLILRLCESSWGKKGGELGSRRVLLVGFVLCMPAVVLFLPAAVSWAMRS